MVTKNGVWRGMKNILSKLKRENWKHNQGWNEKKKELIKIDIKTSLKCEREKYTQEYRRRTEASQYL